MIGPFQIKVSARVTQKHLAEAVPEMWFFRGPASRTHHWKTCSETGAWLLPIVLLEKRKRPRWIAGPKNTSINSDLVGWYY
ncbi:hypothetical protein [Tateyamaria pelophila]|uniref:hypothetical protein n=1 Tax=Tateyamaria pelophila TaxID=328415 RepID=UPI001CBFA05E|nr:hypothetical protein [Tateyamaria pelophila]